MRFVQLFWKMLLVSTVIVLVTAGSCGSDDAAVDDGAVDDAASAAQSGDSGETGNANAAAPGSSSGGGDFQTVYGIPPIGSATVDPNFGEYSETNDGFQIRQAVFFEITGADRDQVVDYYTETLTAAGYQVGAPLILGASVALSLSMPPDQNLSGVIQVGPLSPTDPTLGVNQERIRFIPTEASSSDDAPAESIEADATSDEANG